MNVLDLFSGVGGFSLGLERAGFRTVAFCEIDADCREQLGRHWPGVPIHGDIRTFQPEQGSAEVVCGGFPCQDISNVSRKRSGLAGEHSGLWTEYARIVRAVRPRFVIVENSPSLCVRGMGDVLADLADAGYDAEWEGIPAAAIGAIHLRARQWILAYPAGLRDGMEENAILSGWDRFIDRAWWASEPAICRVDDGVPGRVAQLKQLGNAIVPQIAEIIGRAIMTAPLSPDTRAE